MASSSSVPPLPRTPSERMKEIGKPGIRRLVRRAGGKRMHSEIYEEARHALRPFLENVVNKSVIHTTHARRKTTSVLDVLHSLKIVGYPIYGMGHDINAGPRPRRRKGDKRKKNQEEDDEEGDEEEGEEEDGAEEGGAEEGGAEEGWTEEDEDDDDSPYQEPMYPMAPVKYFDNFGKKIKVVVHPDHRGNSLCTIHDVVAGEYLTELPGTFRPDAGFGQNAYVITVPLWRNESEYTTDEKNGTPIKPDPIFIATDEFIKNTSYAGTVTNDYNYVYDADHNRYIKQKKDQTNVYIIPVAEDEILKFFPSSRQENRNINRLSAARSEKNKPVKVRIFLRAKKAIPANTELSLNYGSEYWKIRNIELEDKDDGFE